MTIPAMTLDTYLAGWSITGAQRRRVSSVVLNLCEALAHTVQHEDAPLLVQRLARSVGSLGVSVVKVDEVVRNVGGEGGALSVILSRSSDDIVHFAVQEGGRSGETVSPGALLASGQITIGGSLKALINVGKGTHLFASDASGSRLRIVPATRDGTVPLAA